MFIVLPVRHGRCFSTSQDMQSLGESVFSEPEGAGLFGQKPLPLVPDWLVHTHANEDAKSMQFDCSKRYYPD